MEKLCLDQLGLEQHRDDVCSAAGNTSRASFVEEKGCLKEKVLLCVKAQRCSKIIVGVCALCSWRRNEEAEIVSPRFCTTVVYLHDLR